jgi:hypothetical protein
MARFELYSINSIECFIYGAQSFVLSPLHLIELNAHLYLSNRVEFISKDSHLWFNNILFTNFEANKMYLDNE